MRSRVPAFLYSVGSAVFFAACVSRPPSVLQSGFPSGKPWYRVEIDSLGRKHGTEEWWFESGAPRYRAVNTHGRRDGTYQAWYPGGGLWYRGRDSVGVPVDTLWGWRPDGRLQRIQVFAAGKTESYEAVDTSGVTRAERLRLDAANALKTRDSAEVRETRRRAALADWARRVRATVETYWIPPRRDAKGLRAHRAVATLRVGADGRVLSVGWAERSDSKAFNDKADKALRRVRRLPPLPPEAAGEPLELRYEFVSAKGKELRRARSFAPADTAGEETTLD